MLVELVTTDTVDGLRLHGALHAPDAAARVAAVARRGEAAILIHGTGSNFYSATLLEHLAHELSAIGVAALRINTRGHDLVSTSGGPLGPRRLGAAYECVADGSLDLAAWVVWLRQRGYERVVLVGHSLGAVKALFAVAHASDEAFAAVRAVAAISPPRLSHQRFVQGARAEEFLGDEARAQALLDDGRGQELLEVRFPLPYPVSAAGFLDKYGSDERYNIERFIGRVPCPALVVLGEVEMRANLAFRGLADDLERLVPDRARLQVEVVSGADHFYAGAHAELWTRLRRWWCRA